MNVNYCEPQKPIFGWKIFWKKIDYWGGVNRWYV